MYTIIIISIVACIFITLSSAQYYHRSWYSYLNYIFLWSFIFLVRSGFSLAQLRATLRGWLSIALWRVWCLLLGVQLLYGNEQRSARGGTRAREQAARHELPSYGYLLPTLVSSTTTSNTPIRPSLSRFLSFSTDTCCQLSRLSTLLSERIRNVFSFCCLFAHDSLHWCCFQRAALLY